MERRAWLGLLGLSVFAARSASAEQDRYDKSYGWVFDNVIMGNVTARELRWAWSLQKHGVDYVKTDAMRASFENRIVNRTELLKNPDAEHVDDECDKRNKQNHFPDYAKIRMLRRLSSGFLAKDLYEHHGWDPNLHALAPGDVLVQALPWVNYGQVIIVQTWKKDLGRGRVAYWDEQREAIDSEPDFPLTLRNKDFAPKDRDPDDDNPTKKRYVRPGLVWLRPVT